MARRPSLAYSGWNLRSSCQADSLLGDGGRWEKETQPLEEPPREAGVEGLTKTLLSLPAEDLEELFLRLIQQSLLSLEFGRETLVVNFLIA